MAGHLDNSRFKMKSSLSILFALPNSKSKGEGEKNTERSGGEKGIERGGRGGREREMHYIL